MMVTYVEGNHEREDQSASRTEDWNAVKQSGQRGGGGSNGNGVPKQEGLQVD